MICETCHGYGYWRGGACPVCCRTSEIEPAKEAWRPIETAPQDATMVDLRDDDGREHTGYWTLCDRGWSTIGVYAWAMTPMGFKPTHWRPR